jgi:UDP-glucose 4-epimerase
MKALIVGATSSLARVLKPVLAEFCEVTTAGREKADLPLDLHASAHNIVFPQGLDVIVHAAAHFGGTSDSDILEAESVNVLGTLKLCQAAVQAGAKHFVLISSMFAHLDASSTFYNIYALSKRHADEAAQFYCASRGLPLTILRPTQIYGDSDAFRRHQPFFYHNVDQAQRAEEVTIYGRNDARRNYIHAADLIRIVTLVIHKRIEGVFSCAHDLDVTYSQVAEAAFAAFGTEKQIRFLVDKADIPDNVFDKDDCLYRKTGFYPQISIEAGMKRIARLRASPA